MNTTHDRDCEPINRERFTAHALDRVSAPAVGFEPEGPITAPAGIARHAFEPTGQFVAHLQYAARLFCEDRPQPLDSAVIHHQSRDTRVTKHA